MLGQSKFWKDETPSNIYFKRQLRQHDTGSTQKATLTIISMMKMNARRLHTKPHFNDTCSPSKGSVDLSSLTDSLQSVNQNPGTMDNIEREHKSLQERRSEALTGDSLFLRDTCSSSLLNCDGSKSSTGVLSPKI
jgi:hypothetical protein